MKRVVAFFDMFDEIPDNSKYLFSRNIEVPAEETEEQKIARLISNNPENQTSIPTVFCVHYYEVDGMDFDELITETEFATKKPGDKIKEFVHRYKIPVK